VTNENICGTQIKQEQSENDSNHKNGKLSAKIGLTISISFNFEAINQSFN